MRAAKIHTAEPASHKHRTAMQWFANLAHAVESSGQVCLTSSLKRSIEAYAIYAETGDERYLGLCESFLQDTLTG